MAKRKAKREVWKRPPPKKARHRCLTAAQKDAAKARAKRAGRPYPNLADNIQVAAAATKGDRPKRKRTKLKDPRGGLTAAGRGWFHRTQRADLKPGVKKSQSEMTPQELRRKGSWAVRFFGRKGELPPLRKPDGSPTRSALTAAAWGEPVPKTIAAARRIAAKGHRLLASYAKAKLAARALRRAPVP